MSAEEPPDPDDPIAHWIEHRKAVRKPETVNQDKSAVKHLREYLEKEQIEPSELTRTKSIHFIEWLKKKPNLDKRTANQYLRILDTFYGYFSDRGTFDTNPIAEARTEVDLEYDDTTHRRDITVEEMADFVHSIEHPLHLAIVVTFAKTGIRLGELCNIDLRDLNLDYPGINNYLPTPRTEIRDTPDSLFVDSEITEGQPYNGEVRQRGNKRERSTVIPIDDELKDVLVYWLASRLPSQSEADPLLQITTGKGGKIHGDRTTANSIHRVLKKETEPYGWWESGEGPEWNVTPHYFRHFFTTHARRQFDDPTVVKYIRGDVGNETMDRYTHQWGDKVETEYRANIFKFFE